jgi:hypothetical protein
VTPRKAADVDRILTLQELQAVDARSLHVTPGGTLDPAPPDVVVEHYQRMASTLVLAPAVGELTRQQFERLHTVFTYGALNYDLFTLVTDAARLTFEQALRDRFMAAHPGTVSLRDRYLNEYQITASGYGQFFEQLQDLDLVGPRIEMADRWIGFNGMLEGLITWARREGLLRGGRSRLVERFLQDMRDEVAHGSFLPVGPGEALMALSTLAEVINQLWGSPTPGGRLYPQPVTRQVMFIAWSASGDTRTGGSAQALTAGTAVADDAWTYVLVRAVHGSDGREDPNLLDFDSLHATTTFPTTLLWGPGPRCDAVQWLRENDPQPDTCDYVDQVFLVRVRDGQALQPMTPAVAAGLDGPDRSGTWYAIRADSGQDAFNHVLAVASEMAGHSPSGECQTCPAVTLSRGTLDTALRAAAKAGADISPVTPPDVRTPMLRHPRSVFLPTSGAASP